MTTLPDDEILEEGQTDSASARPTVVVRETDSGTKPRSLWGDAWDIMRHRVLFWVAAALIVFFLVMAVAPQLFTSIKPLAPGSCLLSHARQAPSSEAIFGYDLQGCDIYARTVYGARSSILVGLLTASVTAIIGAALGTVAAYMGGWVDTLLSRIADIFFAIPLLLGGIIIMYSIPTNPNSPYVLIIFKVVFALSVLGWPNIFRLMRSSVLQVKPNEYVQAARALGASPFHVVGSHIVPNALAPVIVVTTIDLGSYIATEATLSFLGIGLQAPAISWGIAISQASALGYIRQAPHMLLFPALFLCLTVLAFIMLGEVVRDALDPKLR
jgi:oligopeptide transport system permease protein